MGALSQVGNKLGSGSSIGSMFGTAGGVNGTGIKGPGEASIQAGTNTGDVINAQNATGNSLANQQALLQALQGQGGMAQQNAVGAQQQGLANQLAANNGAGNQAAAMQGQGGLNSQLAAANGVGTQNAAIAGLQGTAGMYQDIAAGRGPNPAQAALNQSTGQNVANQAALMAGQRGAGANVGMMARQAAQQGAATQQQAVGQGATMQAQQQVNALSGLSGTQQAMGSLGSTQAGMQQAGITQQGALAGQQIAAQQAQQAAMANQANVVAGQQIGATTANTQANLSNQGQMQGSLAGINTGIVSSQNNINASNAGTANTIIPGQQKAQAGVLSKLPVVGSMFGAEGGEVRRMAEGGYTAPPPVIAPPPQQMGAASAFGQFLSAPAPQAIQEADPSMMVGKPPLPDDEKKESPLPGGMAPPGGMPAGGGEAMAGGDAAGMGGLLSEAAPLLMVAAKGGLAKGGGHVKAKSEGQKAEKGGDDYSNDKINAVLSEHEIVLPRSVTMSDDPVAKSAEFVKNELHLAEGGAASNEGGMNAKKPLAGTPIAPPPGAEIMDAPAAQQAPAAAPVQQAPQAPAQSISAPAQEITAAAPSPAQDLKQQDALWQQDLQNGHIQPKTYADLFAKKDTLGKIGTVFGLLLGGAGNGITGQPDALLHMMDKEIALDLEAQKNSKENAKSYIRLNQENQMNQASIAQMVKAGTLTEAQASAIKKETDVKAYALSRMQMNRAALHDLTMRVAKLPVGSPQRLAAEQQLAIISNTIQNENFDISDRAEAAGALSKVGFGANGAAAAPASEEEFQKEQAVLRLSGNAAIADDKAARHFPGIPGQASIPLGGGDREQINSGMNFDKQMTRFMDWTKKHSGDLNPKERAAGIALAAELQGAYRQATQGGVYKEGEQNFISKLIDSTPTKFFNEIRVMPSLRAVHGEHKAKLDQLLKSKGFQGYPGHTTAEGKSPGKDPDEGKIAKNAETGQEWVRKAGKWVETKKATATKAAPKEPQASGSAGAKGQYQ